jgi:hypothetical protein
VHGWGKDTMQTIAIYIIVVSFGHYDTLAVASRIGVQYGAERAKIIFQLYYHTVMINYGTEIGNKVLYRKKL